MSLLAPERPVRTHLADPPARPRSRWAALPVLLVAVFMTTLDFFIVNAAGPAARRDLDAGATAMQTVLIGYGMAYAAGLITAGRLGDLYGPRRVFAAGLALFTAASAACGLAPDAEFLVGARIVQGLAAALMGPQVLALLGTLFPGADRARAFAWYGATVGLAGTGGQVVGGLLVAVDPAGLGWRTCFLVNIPLGAAALLFAPAVLPRGERSVPDRNGLDLLGAALAAAGLIAVVLPLAAAPEAGTSWWTWPVLASAVPLFAAFAAQQRRRTAAGRGLLVDPAVFRERGFAAGLLCIALLFGASAGLTSVLAVGLQDGAGLSPLAAGAICTALNAGFFATSMHTGRLTGRLGSRLPLIGAAVLAAGLAATGWAAPATGTSVPLGLIAGLAVTGAGMGLLMAPLTAAALVGVRTRLSGTAAAVLGTVQEVAGALGIAVTGLVFHQTLGAGLPAAGDPRWTTAFRAASVLLVLAASAIAAVHIRARAVRD
ncbi:MFS transporter [Yinghuangia soli]|uniref:MFS transporter n=1 Tax=Yinghuangia soli TaxID=2908204 RepID=A0AA41Q0K2_9ACTN|nr:MFS transporter [Yinghuangia soli]MCF2529278.1 MFS transporter [Yinghuangia soli]